MATLELPYGQRRVAVTLPDEWLGESVSPRPVLPAPDVPSLLTAVLAQPIGSPPLRERVRPGQKAAVIVDDATRQTPVALFLPLVLAQLLTAGIDKQDIRLVVALGTHRPLTPAEIEAKIGAKIAAQYEVINLPGAAADEMVYLGASSNGIPAWVNRAVAEAEVRIGLGMITPHMDAGFSGGAKIILPGVCSSLTVAAFHTASAFVPDNQLGQLNAPLRRNLEQFVAERVPLDFIVNVVLTLEGQIYQAAAGHFIEAHRAGARYAQAVFGAPARRRYPVVVANCYPYDRDWWQSGKGVFAGDLLTADGGTLIVVTAAPEGHSNYPLYPHYIARSPDELITALQGGGTLEGGNQAPAGAQFARLRRRIKLALVSSGLSQAEAEVMGLDYYNSVEEAVTAAVTQLPAAERPGSVAVLPQGGVVLPMVEG